jgi:nitrate reductase gamma subunit
MNAMSGAVLLTVAYGGVGVFLVAFLVRSLRIARLPVHLRWELAPVPKEKERGRYGGSYLEEYEWWKKPREESLASEAAYMAQEILLLKALLEHNRPLWWFSFPFHLGLYLLVGAFALVGLGGAVSAWAGPSAVPALLEAGLAWVAGIGYALGALGALGLLASRILNPELRRFTTPVALFNLILIEALCLTGGVAVLVAEGFTGVLVETASGVLTASAPADVPGILAAHLVLTLAFLAYLPFSQMMHFVDKYFTYHQVRWEDRPLERGSALEREVEELLQEPVTWAGPHVRGGGRSWVEVATETTAEEGR